MSNLAGYGVIACVGNRLVPSDSSGPRVFDLLASRRLPARVRLLDAGTCGLDLLRWFDGARQVVLVDSFWADGDHGTVVLSLEEALGLWPTTLGHGADLAYLLRSLPRVCERAVPEVSVVAVSEPAREPDISQAADLALQLLDAGTQRRQKRSWVNPP